MSKPTIFPGADFRPLGKQTESRMTSHDIVCLHTMVGGLAGTEAFFKADGFGGTESHFGIGARGEMIQWQDLDFTADANLDGNHRVISIETADSGSPFPDWSGSDVPGWTPAQVDAIVEVVTWLCRRYDIPASLIPDTRPGRRGIGYHRQGIDGSFKDGRVPDGERWSSSDGKVCPGDRRVGQQKRTVIRRVNEALKNGQGKPDVDRQPAVTLGRVVKAAEAAMIPGVRVIEQALVDEGLLDKSRADGVWGPKTTTAYAKWQRKCGFTGTDADGVPGAESLTKLGAARGFKVLD